MPLLRDSPLPDHRMPKIPLQVKKKKSIGENDKIYITHSYPFFRPRLLGHRFGYVHRVKSASIYYHQGKFLHICIGYWCGGTGFISDDEKRKESKLLEFADGPICATCEVKALVQKLPSSEELNQGVVEYRPSERKKIIQAIQNRP